MDAKCANSSQIESEWRSALEHPQLIECVGICVVSMAYGSKLGGSDFCLHNMKKRGKFSLNSARVFALGWPLFGFFLGIFQIFVRGVCGANHL